MEKLDKVIAGLSYCCEPNNLCKDGCPYEELDWCEDQLMRDALELLKSLDGKYRAAVEMAAIATERAAARMGDDLIDRESLLEAMNKLHGVGGIYLWDPEEVLAVIKKAPAVEDEPVVHAHWVDRPDGAYRICSNCRSGVPTMQRPLVWIRCPVCGAYMDEKLELRTCYCPLCDKHFEVRSNDSMGSCPDCGHHVVLHRKVEVTDD